MPSRPSLCGPASVAQPPWLRLRGRAVASAADSVGILRKGEWADVKVQIIGGTLAGLTAGFLVRVEELTGNLSRVRLFHTSVSRAIASWPR